jgi:hypothetical protein
MGPGENLMQMSDFELASELRSLSMRASESEQEAQETLEQLVRACDAKAWESHPRFCSSVTSALIQAGTHRSMLFIMRFLRDIPSTVTFGAMEMMAGQLTIYGASLLPTLRSLAESSEEASRAVGIQTLCNMYFEHKLPHPDEEFLYSQIKDFKDDRFATGHLAELVRDDIQSRKGEDSERLLKDIIGL